jgi:predicted GNAT family acetyltransferase
MTALRPGPELGAARMLDDRDLPALLALLDAAPTINVVLAARLAAIRTLDPERLGGSVIGLDSSIGLRAACFVGGNLLPVGGDAECWPALVDYLLDTERVCSSIVGSAGTVDALWPALRPAWGSARLVRRSQPLLVTGRPSQLAPDPQVRAVGVDELERYLPAAAAMFAEELALTPFEGPTRPTYRLRLAELLAGGRAFARFDRRGEVIFKAEIGAVSRHTCQVQGVWVRPDLRGRGVGTTGMAAVLAAALRLAPTVSLYVNEFNGAARRVYERNGMRQVGTLSTVLF